MHRKSGVVGLPLVPGGGEPMSVQRVVERLVALGYGWTYDAVVRGFPPYEALLDEIAALVRRSVERSGGPARVRDIACGVGTVARRLARDGHHVVGVDAIEHLVDVARAKRDAAGPGDLAFHHVDLAESAAPGGGTYDVLVSMHTLYWHPNPHALLDACRRALRPGGHAIFLTYVRPARVGKTFREVRQANGLAAAFRSLRWLAPTALFETFRSCECRYLTLDQFHGALGAAGFEVLESRATFLAGISLLAWARVGTAVPTAPTSAAPFSSAGC